METDHLPPRSSSGPWESVLRIKSYDWFGLLESRDLCGCRRPPAPPAASSDTPRGPSPPPAGSYSWDVALPAEETVNVNTRERPHPPFAQGRLSVRVMFLDVTAHFTSPCWQVLNHNWFLVRPEEQRGQEGCKVPHRVKKMF